MIDLRLFLDLPPAQNPGEGLLLTVQNPAMQVIFFVDDVPGVESVQPKGMLSKDSGLHHLPAGYVRAVIERQGNRSRQPYITLLDMAALLSDPQLRIDQEQG